MLYIYIYIYIYACTEKNINLPCLFQGPWNDGFQSPVSIDILTLYILCNVIHHVEPPFQTIVHATILILLLNLESVYWWFEKIKLQTLTLFFVINARYKIQDLETTFLVNVSLLSSTKNKKVARVQVSRFIFKVHFGLVQQTKTCPVQQAVISSLNIFVADG